MFGRIIFGGRIRGFGGFVKIYCFRSLRFLLLCRGRGRGRGRGSILWRFCVEVLGFDCYGYRGSITAEEGSWGFLLGRLLEKFGDRGGGRLVRLGVFGNGRFVGFASTGGFTFRHNEEERGLENIVLLEVGGCRPLDRSLTLVHSLRDTGRMRGIMEEFGLK